MQEKKKIGLFFGSFNPIHIGHLIIANHMVEYSDLDQVWLVVSPQNPFKDKKTLLNQNQRLEMVRIAIEDYPGLKASNVEFNLPQPSYTIHTLVYLQDLYPDMDFHLIVGSDNLENFHKWKNYEQILSRHKLYVYPRPHTNKEKINPAVLESVIWVAAPLIEISSTFIRQAIKNDKNYRPLLPEKVYDFIYKSNYYKN